MIVMTRIDYRLLHGQVAFAWTNNLSANAILIANDSVAKDNFRKKTLQLAKPDSAKLIFKSIEDSAKAIASGVTDKYRVFIVVENIHDAYRLAKKVPQIKLIDLGLSDQKEGSKNIAKSVYVTPEESGLLTELENNGIQVLVKQAPGDPDIEFSTLI
ncbi:PTS sugar transporter subunit IIB [Pediococcus acidilactici]|uniref:PTS sugar transporter subunit IIB n=1 Tax=Pediococcus acidilactici TaxID=1254 RepID=UPI001F4D627F|nr:PTS sugar transporter subunit IIB [Pediococcus acidilactici]MCH9267698.1 PTS sugar transporter subunit IIB [Pediococcus acidilactici]MCJ2387023.1 PTS sugar transporter subunit IIB [Pediococcus acidilactici]MCK2074913.1 PTS sugar transporter subunit IIB [Pediococcus acidilactici]MDM5041852.1 PTS sugar transporter subunit IIB [Pediococcus acidilactici]MDV2603876.1 PTS sugar transporter subunit IIB [Pediococcus acidilactici]